MDIIRIKKDEEGAAKGNQESRRNGVYAISYVERKQKDQPDVKKYRYAVMVEIEFVEGALSAAMHGPHGAMDGGTANKLVNDGKGVIEDRKPNEKKYFIYNEKPPDMPKEILIFETGKRNKLVYKLERSYGSATGHAANYSIV